MKYTGKTCAALISGAMLLSSVCCAPVASAAEKEVKSVIIVTDKAWGGGEMKQTDENIYKAEFSSLLKSRAGDLSFRFLLNMKDYLGGSGAELEFNETDDLDVYTTASVPLVYDGDFIKTDIDHQHFGATFTLDLTSYDPETNTGAEFSVVLHDESFMPAPDYVNIPETRIVGDTDGNGIVTINDATAIQQHLAMMSGKTLTGTALAAADTDCSGTVNITDATLIQYYCASIPDSTSQIGKLVSNENEPPFEGLKVRASSNVYPEVCRTFDPETKQITVTYMINLKEYDMLNAQWTMYFDRTRLELDKTEGVNFSRRKQLLFPVADNAMINADEKLLRRGMFSGNASNLDGYPLSGEDGEDLVFFTATFNTKDGAEGEAFIFFDLEVLSVIDSFGDGFSVINKSKVNYPDVVFIPNENAAALY